MRNRIYEIIEVGKEDDLVSKLYDWFMIAMIVASIIPLTFVEQKPIFEIIDKVTVTVFIVDYVLRFITADLRLEKGLRSFVVYPFTVLAIIDLVSILPSLIAINSGFKLLKVIRLLRAAKVLKVFKAARYSKNIRIIINVFKKQANLLAMVGVLAIGYIFLTAIIVLNVEPETFDSFFKAIYWSTVSLTTMGYGDIYPVSIPGQLLTMISGILGIAIVALPAGIITAGYMEEINNQKDE